MEDLVTPKKWLLPLMWWGFGHNILKNGHDAYLKGEIYGMSNPYAINALYIISGFAAIFCSVAAVMALIVAVQHYARLKSEATRRPPQAHH
jgi:hypothetical protein